MKLHRAVHQGVIDVAAMLLGDGHDPNEPEARSSRVPLAIAAASPWAGPDMLALLIEQGADPNAAGEHESPLRVAVATGDLNKVNVLLDHGADVHRVDANGYSLLILAMCVQVFRQGVDVVQRLIRAGAAVDCESSYGESALSIASREARLDLAKLLLDAGANAKFLAWTPLHAAVAFGSRSDVETALRHSPDLEARDGWARTPLLLAIHRGDFGIASCLLDGGADASVLGHCGRTPAQYAARNDGIDGLQWLLDQGFALDLQDEYGGNAANTACEHASAKALTFLLEHGVATNEWIPAHALDVDTLSVLLPRGFDLSRAGPDGETPLMDAVSSGDMGVFEWLLDAGVDIRATSTGSTALHRAVTHDHVPMVARLLATGADPNAADVDGYTPCFDVRSAAVLRMLLDAGGDLRRPTHPGGPDALRWNRDPDWPAILAEAGFTR